MALLRYPGGKSRMLTHLWPYLEHLTRGNAYAEPFVGGGSTALKVAENCPKIDIILNDLDSDISNFWKVIAAVNGDDDFKSLCSIVEDSKTKTDDPSERFNYWKQVKNSKPSTQPERAFKLLFLNKTCYGGLIDGAPIGGWHQQGWEGRGNRRVVCQYTVERIIRELEKAHTRLKHRTQIENLDVLAFLKAHSQCPAYLDPPYYNAHRQYRYHMNNEQHEALAACLKERHFPWIVSYNSHTSIKMLYSWTRIDEFEVGYSNAQRKRIKGHIQKWTKKQELIIISPDLQCHTVPKIMAKKTKVTDSNTTLESVPMTYTICAAVVSLNRLVMATISTTSSTAQKKLTQATGKDNDVLSAEGYKIGYFDVIPK